MISINENFLKLQAGYLFPEIARRVNLYSSENSDAAKSLIRCGIGDVTEPLPLTAREALKAGVDELGSAATFRGYGPEQGYDFLREAIADHAYAGVDVNADEVFVSDGSKCDTSNILDIFGHDNKIGITDPVYPVYVDTNVMAGHTGEADESGSYAGLHYLECNKDNGFVPSIPDEALDIVYLCYPNNPTGAVATREQLEAWVAYALKHKAILLYDAAYEAFIQDDSVPHSIYEIEGARDCAIEFRSFSKNGGFTGVRCAYSIVPKNLTATTSKGEEVTLHSLWQRRQSTKFNGVSYPVQKAAAALFTPEGKAEIGALIANYMENAQLLSDACKSAGLTVYGGENAPYVWIACPEDLDSWGAFDLFLEKAQVVVTPGAGFGQGGEGYFRISAFNSRSNVEEVCKRITNLFN